MITCAYPDCPVPAILACECCETVFCSDHGTRGGDQEGGTNPDGSPHGAYSEPSACWKCGGFNADAD